jgi:hypothetical protein
MPSKEPKASNVNNDLIIYRLDEIKNEIVDIKKQYVTKEESLAMKAEIHGLRNEIAELKRSRNLIGWLYPTASAAFSALFTYLIIEFFRIK